VQIGASRLENGAIIILGKLDDFEDEETWQELGAIEEEIRHENESEIIMFFGVQELEDIESWYDRVYESSPSKPIPVFKRELNNSGH
jgi:hypothetical protein